MMERMKHILTGIMVLAILGVVVSAYSFAHKEGFTSGAVCNVNDTFNCDVVNQGSYSELFGIPVAIIGILGYGFLFVASVLKKKHQEDKGLSKFLLLASVGGFLFALYLTGIEAFVLHAWCIVCLTSQALIAGILVLSVIHYLKEKQL